MGLREVQPGAPDVPPAEPRPRTKVVTEPQTACWIPGSLNGRGWWKAGLDCGEPCVAVTWRGPAERCSNTQTLSVQQFSPSLAQPKQLSLEAAARGHVYMMEETEGA